jgi:hypothetical protein
MCGYNLRSELKICNLTEKLERQKENLPGPFLRTTDKQRGTQKY